MNKEGFRHTWSERVAQHRASGLTGKEWCELWGFEQHRPWCWVKMKNEAGAGDKWPMGGEPAKAVGKRELRWLLDGLPLDQKSAHIGVSARTIL